MALQPGKALTHYTILDLLGAGAMGEVYRARDARLGRDVAIKVLPETLADPERLRRFEREAQTLASLNHPNVAQIHGFDKDGDTTFLVLELVPGETLAQRLDTGPLPIEDALNVCVQIAAGLEAAHEAGVIHRDLKPGNIMLTQEGKVKVLDFGLARAERTKPSSTALLSTGSSSSSASRGPLTEEGVILGTPGYMSPEQLRGKPIDRRADLFAFGCILYACLTGKAAFEGESMGDVIVAILGNEPDYTRLPVKTSPRIRELIAKCLEKDVAHRLRDAGDARIELERAIANREWSTDRIEAYAGQARTGSSLRRLTPWLAGGGIGAAAAAALAFVLAPKLWQAGDSAPVALPPVSRFVVNPASLPVSFEIDTTARLTISPDGARVAFVAKDASDNTLKVFLREMSSLDTTPVAGSVDPYDPFFSTDGQWIFFASKDYLWKVPVSGGPRTEVTKLTGFHKGSAWCADGVLCAPSASTGLYRVSTSGGGLEALTRLDASKNEVSHRWPEILPGGRQVLCTIKKSGIATFDEAEIAVYSLDTKTWKTIHRGGYYARYARSGHLLYIRDGALMAAPFDLTRLDVVGPAARVVAGVMCEPGSGAAQYALSSTGTLVYVPGGPYERPWEFFWLHKDGTETPVGSPLRPVVHFRLSRDGTRIAQVISGATDSAFVFDIGRGMLTRATFDGNVNNLSWTHDGKSLVYVSDLDGGGIFQSPVDGSGTPVKLLGSPDSISRVEICGGSKPALIYVKGNMGARDIWQVSLDTGAAETPLVKTPFDESDGLVSPDGRWLAYESNETGRREIYVSPYPPGGGRWQVSKDGGFAPIWSPDSSRLYFRLENGNPQVDLEAVQKLMVVSLAAAGGFSASAPQVAFEWTGTDVVDLSPDGEKLLAARRQKPTFQSTEIIAVVNWFDELKAKVPLR